jgi:hypothetical protein
MQKPDQQYLLKLPHSRLRSTLVIALIAGLVASAQTILVTLINGGLYRQAAQYASSPSKMPISTALTIFGLFGLTSLISALIYFVAGFIDGKFVVSRRQGFLCGFVAGAISQVLGYLVQYVPGYPATVNSGVSGGLIGAGTGVITALILLLVAALIAGLISFLGSWLATRRHPYYAS